MGLIPYTRSRRPMRSSSLQLYELAAKRLPDVSIFKAILFYHLTQHCALPSSEHTDDRLELSRSPYLYPQPMDVRHQLCPVEVSASGVIHHPIEEVWSAIAAFGDMGAFMSSMGSQAVRTSLVAGLSDNQVGARRVLHIRGGRLFEELTAIDLERYRIAYKLVSDVNSINPFSASFLNYRCTLKLRAVTTSQEALLEMNGRFMTEFHNAPMMEGQWETIYGDIINALNAHLSMTKRGHGHSNPGQALSMQSCAREASFRRSMSPTTPLNLLTSPADSPSSSLPELEGSHVNSSGLPERGPPPDAHLSHHRGRVMPPTSTPHYMTTPERASSSCLPSGPIPHVQASPGHSTWTSSFSQEEANRLQQRLAAARISEANAQRTTRALHSPPSGASQEYVVSHRLTSLPALHGASRDMFRKGYVQAQPAVLSSPHPASSPSHSPMQTMTPPTSALLGGQFDGSRVYLNGGAWPVSPVLTTDVQQVSTPFANPALQRDSSFHSSGGYAELQNAYSVTSDLQQGRDYMHTRMNS